MKVDYTKMKELREIAHDHNEPMSNRMQAAARYEAILDEAAKECASYLATLTGGKPA